MLSKETRRKLLKKNYDQQRHESNREKDKERCHKKYIENRESILKQQHEYYFSHKEQKKIYNKAYHLRKKKE